MNNNLIDHTPEREIASALIPYFGPGTRPGQPRLEETAGLIEALGCELAFLRGEYIRNPNASVLISGGLLDRFAEDLAAAKCTIAIIDTSLTPVQQRNLETRLGVKVIDRTGLILEIFGLRARTSEGRLQVELARLLYERSRLVRTWTHLERQRGGGGFLSGPGESQLEADRRMLDDKILRLRSDLKDVTRTRAVQRAARTRSGKKIIALVGYTNSGKSTLFNALSGADVFARDMPFATLDPTIRRIDLSTLGEAALIDTVGFITDLPTHLIDSFKATLEEAMHADLLVHVRDRSGETDMEQAVDVMQVLGRLQAETGLELPPIIEAWNKADLLSSERREVLAIAAQEAASPAAVLVSAVNGEGLEELVGLIESSLMKGATELTLLLKPSDGAARAWLHENGDIVSETIADNGNITLTVRLPRDRLGQFESEYTAFAQQ